MRFIGPAKQFFIFQQCSSSTISFFTIGQIRQQKQDELTNLSLCSLLGAPIVDRWVLHFVVTFCQNIMLLRFLYFKTYDFRAYVGVDLTNKRIPRENNYNS